MTRYASRNRRKKAEPRWYAFLKAATDILGQSPRMQKGLKEIISNDHIMMVVPPAGKATNLIRAWYEEDGADTGEMTRKVNPHDTFVNLTDSKNERGKVQLSIHQMKKILTMMESIGEEHIAIHVFQSAPRGQPNKDEEGSYGAWGDSMPAMIQGPEKGLTVLLAPVIPSM